MLLFALAACPSYEYDTGSNLCGTIDAPGSAPAVTGVAVMEVLDGKTACVGGDTGGSGGWWGEIVAEPAVDGDHFQATVEPGSYGIEVYTDGDWGGCGAAEVTDTTTCSADVVIEVAEMIYVDKPNVYLYPETPTRIDVRIPAWRRITESEPRYPVDGWKVTAFPDGRLATPVGQRDYLFYELNADTSRFQTDAGWCVRGGAAQASIEEVMDDLGFLPNEIADFADAWDPEFPAAEWMTVYPQIDTLTGLRIDPAPDNLLRAWFVVANGCQAVEAPVIERVDRAGYHAAEWGIAFTDDLDRPTVIVEGWR